MCSDVSDLMRCAKTMCEKHGVDACIQLPLWTEHFGFPDNGGLSVGQIQRLQDKLEKHEKEKGKI